MKGKVGVSVEADKGDCRDHRGEGGRTNRVRSGDHYDRGKDCGRKIQSGNHRHDLCNDFYRRGDERRMGTCRADLASHSLLD